MGRRSHSLEVERIDDVGGLRGLASSWNPLLDTALPGNPYLTWEWVSTFWQVYGSGPISASVRAALYVLTVRRAGRLVAILPCYRSTTPLGPLWPLGGIRKLRLFATGPSHLPTDLDLLCADADAPEVATALSAYLERHRDDWDVLDFGSVRRAGVGVSALLSELSARFHTSDSYSHSNRHAALPQSWTSYLARISPGYAKKLQRYERRLQREHPFRLVVCREEAQLDRALADLIRIRLGSWHKSEPHAFLDRRFVTFHRQLLPQLLHKGWLRLAFLEDERGERLAGGYLILRKGLATFYQQARLQELEKFHVGSVLIAQLLRLAIEEGAHSFDFGCDAPYKSHFAWETREDRRVRVYNTSLSARVQLAHDELRSLAQSIRTPEEIARYGG